jgi:hypothetical protein
VSARAIGAPTLSGSARLGDATARGRPEAEEPERRLNDPHGPASSPAAAAGQFAETEAVERAELLRPDEVRLCDGAHENGKVLASCPAAESHADRRGLPPVSGGVTRASLVPTAADRYRVQFTASAELKRKLERLQTLMLGSIPGGDLVAVIEAAVTAHIERREEAPRRRASACSREPQTVA